MRQSIEVVQEVEAVRVRTDKVHLAAEPESFLVTKENQPEPGEAARAQEWGRTLADTVAPGTGS